MCNVILTYILVYIFGSMFSSLGYVLSTCALLVFYPILIEDPESPETLLFLFSTISPVSERFSSSIDIA